MTRCGYCRREGWALLLCRERQCMAGAAGSCRECKHAVASDRPGLLECAPGGRWRFNTTPEGICPQFDRDAVLVASAPQAEIVRIQ
jgi:hypothetical protein